MEKFWTWLENIKPYKYLSEHKLFGKIFNREMISYLFFGVLTTVVSLVSFYIVSRIFDALSWQGVFHLIDKRKDYAYIDANVISFVFAVAFAFITNKLFVFNSKARDASTVLRELISFFGARISTLLIDTGLMYLLVSLIGMREMIAKLIIQVIVVVLNYVFSKLFVFGSKSKDDKS